jgi:hypothetical protein
MAVIWTWIRVSRAPTVATLGDVQQDSAASVDTIASMLVEHSLSTIIVSLHGLLFCNKDRFRPHGEP